VTKINEIKPEFLPHGTGSANCRWTGSCVFKWLTMLNLLQCVQLAHESGSEQDSQSTKTLNFILGGGTTSLRKQ